jgi:ribonuclease BN (tRNA processing enzyme)
MSWHRRWLPPAATAGLVWGSLQANCDAPNKNTSQVIFMGTGTSSGNPHMHCLLKQGTKSAPVCNVCLDAAKKGPTVDNRDWRGNPSLLIKYVRKDQERPKYILIDAGKTFRESVLRWFPHFRIPGLDALILTHEHTDACWGLDDMRSCQLQKPMHVYLSQQCYKSMRNVYPYLMPKPPGGKASSCCNDVDQSCCEVIKPSTTFIAQMAWDVVSTDPRSSFEVEGLTITPVPVEHGKGFMSLGFAFGPDSSKVRYAE